MPKDKYTAVWVSHSSLNDFLTCPRAYFLKNVYKDPRTKHKIQLTSPSLALGSAVHEVIESLSVLPAPERFKESLIAKFDKVWLRHTGKKGGFFDPETEQQFKDRGHKMLRRVENNPGPLKNLAVKINMDLPYYWLSDSDNIILCGKIDWLEYLPDTDTVNIIDFKTGKNEEDEDSLQLPIYQLLVENTQGRQVVGASYWYLEFDDGLSKKDLYDTAKAKEEVLKIAKQIKLARQLERFKCETGGCRACKPYEAILSGLGELVGVSEYGNDLYVVSKEPHLKESQIL